LVNLREAHFVCKHKVVQSGALATTEIVELHLTLADEQGASVTIELDTS
jgi:penicillin V acylase-like amidase (Ntn superfamily)